MEIDKRTMDFLSIHRIAHPDNVVLCLDPFESELPIVEHGRGKEAYLPCAYLWVDEGCDGDSPTYLYAGKAAKPKNRLRNEWMGPRSLGWIESYYEEVFRETSTLSGSPIVYMWFTDDRAALESRLIQAFHPIYNMRLE